MNLPTKIIDLILVEQVRHKGNFVPEDDAYFEKLANNAELLSHDSLDQCLGFVLFYCNDPAKYSSYISLLIVAQSSRKSGIGAALVRYVLTTTAQRGFKVCRLEVRKENTAALKLYETMGFCQIENRGDKYLMEAQAGQTRVSHENPSLPAKSPKSL